MPELDEGYFSHLPVLSAATTITTGPVLEMGAGLGSTLMLHGMCGASGRKLHTVESDQEWMYKFQPFGRDWHTFKHVATFESLPEYKEPWDLAFVDHGISEQRGYSVNMLKDVSIVVVHDTCHPHLYGYEPILSEFSFRWDLKVRGPQTTIVSNSVDVAEVFAGFLL